jgi:hypothetical protein
MSSACPDGSPPKPHNVVRGLIGAVRTVAGYLTPLACEIPFEIVPPRLPQPPVPRPAHLQRGNHGGCLSRRDAEPLGQGGPGAGRGIAAGAQRGEQRGQEHVAPLIGCALDHAEQAPMHHLKRLGLEVGEKEEEPSVRRRQGAVCVHGTPARGPRLSIHAPRRHPSLEGSCAGWDQLRKLVERQAGQLQKLPRAGR